MVRGIRVWKLRDCPVGLGRQRSRDSHWKAIVVKISYGIGKKWPQNPNLLVIGVASKPFIPLHFQFASSI